jgi:hypothetical protein
MKPTQKTFHLITNVSGMTYWSYELTVNNLYDADLEMHKEAVSKYGKIYVNRNLGYFHKGGVKEIHKTVKAFDFPPENDVVV